MSNFRKAVADRWQRSWLWKVAYVLLAIFLINTVWVMKGSLPMTGTVVDEGTGKPIPDAAVLMKWYGVGKGSWLPVIALHRSRRPRCYHTEFARTDREGRYRISGWWEYGPLAPLVRLSSEYKDIQVYREGYKPFKKQEFEWHIRHRLVLKRFGGSDDERIENLRKAVSFGCTGAPSERNEVPYLEAISHEVSQLKTVDPLRPQLTINFITHILQEIKHEGPFKND